MQVKVPSFMKGKTQRGSWVFDRKMGKLVPRDEYYARQADTTVGLQVMADIKPYKSVTGEIIGGRKQHRDFLRAHGLVEVGNEKPTGPKPQPLSDPRHEVKQALEMVRGGYRPRPLDVFREE